MLEDLQHDAVHNDIVEQEQPAAKNPDAEIHAADVVAPAEAEKSPLPESDDAPAIFQWEKTRASHDKEIMLGDSSDQGIADITHDVPRVARNYSTTNTGTAYTFQKDTASCLTENPAPVSVAAEMMETIPSLEPVLG